MLSSIQTGDENLFFRIFLPPSPFYPPPSHNTVTTYDYIIKLQLYVYKVHVSLLITIKWLNQRNNIGFIIELFRTIISSFWNITRVSPSVRTRQPAIFANLGMLELSYWFQTFRDYSLSSYVPCKKRSNSIINTRTSVCPL